MEAWITKNPWAAVAIALVVGMGAGVVLNRKNGAVDKLLDKVHLGKKV